MPDIGIQFLALPEELADFFGECVKEHDLHVVKVSFPPYHAEEVAPESLRGLFSDSSNTQAIGFTTGTPTAMSQMRQFRDANPDGLHLEIGKRSKEGIKESFLSARTSNKGAYAIWKKIAKKLKAITSAGAIVIHPVTGVTGPAQWYRFTEGAKAAAASGTMLLSSTGHLIKPNLKDENRPTNLDIRPTPDGFVL